MSEEQCSRFLRYLAAAAAICALFYLTVRYLIWWVLPFLIALAVAAAIEPIIVFLHEKLGFRRGFSAFVLTLTLLFLLGGILSLLGTTLAGEAYALLGKVPLLLEHAPQALEGLFARLEAYSSTFPPWLREQLYGLLSDALSGAGPLLSDLAARLLSALTSLAAALPRIALGCATAVLAVYFTAASYPTLCGALRSRISGKTRRTLRLFRSSAAQSLARYLRAELTLSLFTFLQLLAGLTLLRQSYALLLALLITLLDALPVFGAGTALVPWALIELLFSSVPKGIALLTLYLCTLLVRSTLEPKLIASHAGLPPVASLFAMYLGFCTFGIAGMILFPFLLLLTAQLLRNVSHEKMQKREHP